VGRMAEAHMIGMAGSLLRRLGDGRRDRAGALLSQLRCAGEGIRGYRSRRASVPGPIRLAAVHLVPWHLRASLLGVLGL
jgi:hypothetical protein